MAVLLPHGAFLKEDRLTFTLGTAEPLGVSPPEAVDSLLIEERTTPRYRQERRGRPGPEARYVKREDTRFDLTWRLAHDRLATEALCDGIFPLITNVVALSG